MRHAEVLFGAPLPSFAALRKKVALTGANDPSFCPRLRRSGDQLPLGEAGAKRLMRGTPAAAINVPDFLRIRRSPLRFVTLSRRLRRASFFAAKD